MVCACTLGASSEVTLSAPPARIVRVDAWGSTMKAWAAELTKFVANTRLAVAPAPVELASLLVLALSSAMTAALTDRSPPTSTALSSIQARAETGSWAARPAPKSASTACPKMFCGCQPRVLKASVTPAARPPDAMVAVLTASILASFSASTLRLPAACTWLWLRLAMLVLSTRLLAIKPLSASCGGDLLSAKLPTSFTGLSAPVCAWPLTTACMPASCRAFTVTSPPALSATLSSPASTALRTSLRTTTPPTAAPPLLALISTSASICALSMAWTVSDPSTDKDFRALTAEAAAAARSVSGLIQARASELTRLLAKSTLTAPPPASAVTTLLRVADSCAP